MATKSIFEYLALHGIHDSLSGAEAIKKVSAREAAKLGYGLEEIVKENFFESEGNESEFTFSASNSLSGGTHPCQAMECRLGNMRRLSIFGALYADKLIIPDFFGYLTNESTEFRNEESEWRFKERLISDITVLFNWQPLINSSVVDFTRGKLSICDHCYKRRLEEEADSNVNIAEMQRSLREKLASEIDFRLTQNRVLEMNGAANYIGTDAIEFHELPPSLKKFQEGREHRFSKSEVLALGFVDKFILRPTVKDLLNIKFEDSLSSVTYLTDKLLEADIINALTIDSEREKSGAMLNGLVHQLPIVEINKLDKNFLDHLLKLREKEYVAFESYRYEFKKIIAEASRINSEQEFRVAVRDLIQPRLHEIDQIIKSNQDFYTEKVKSQVVFNAVAFTAGLFLPTPLNFVAQGATVYKLKDIADNFSNAKNIPTKARENNLFFLWQANTKIRSLRSHDS